MPRKSKPTPTTQAGVLLKDDSGHFYFVPFDLADDFHKLLDQQSEHDDESFNNVYEQYRLGMHLSQYIFELVDVRPS